MVNTFGVPVRVDISTVDEGELFATPTPLNVVALFDSPTAAGTCPDDDQAFRPGAEISVNIKAVFPYSAGNEYQGLNGSTTTYVTVTEINPRDCDASAAPPAPPPGAPQPPSLAFTGSDVMTGLLIGLAGLVAGLFFLIKKRRSKEHPAE